MPTQWPQLSEAFIHFHSEGGSKTCQNFTQDTTMHCLHFKNPVINFVWYKLPTCHLFKQCLHFFQRTQSGQSGTNPILLFRVTDHSRSHFKNKCRGLRHSATGTHRGQVPSPPIPENTFIHSKTQQLWPRTKRWGTFGFQSQILNSYRKLPESSAPGKSG